MLYKGVYKRGAGDGGNIKIEFPWQHEGKKCLTGKPEWSVLPMDALIGVVRVFEKGQIKYGSFRTWLPGIRFGKLFSAIVRHLFGWFYFGHNVDKESGEHPLCHVIANALMLLTFIDKPKFDDRPGTHKYTISPGEAYGKMINELAEIARQQGEAKR